MIDCIESLWKVHEDTYNYFTIIYIFFPFRKLTKQCWVLWFFLKPANKDENLSFIKSSSYLYTNLSTNVNKCEIGL